MLLLVIVVCGFIIKEVIVFSTFTYITLFKFFKYYILFTSSTVLSYIKVEATAEVFRSNKERTATVLNDSKKRQI